MFKVPRSHEIQYGVQYGHQKQEKYIKFTSCAIHWVPVNRKQDFFSALTVHDWYLFWILVILPQINIKMVPC